MSTQGTKPDVWFTPCRLQRRYLVKVEPGAELPAALLSFAEQAGVRQGVLLSAQGSVSDLTFATIRAGSKLPITWPRMPIHRLEGPLSLISLEGNLFPDEQGELDCQLVVAAARSSGEVIGGRLISARVFATCELLFSEYSVEGVERHRSITGGVETLHLNPSGEATESLTAGSHPDVREGAELPGSERSQS